MDTFRGLRVLARVCAGALLLLFSAVAFAYPVSGGGTVCSYSWASNYGSGSGLSTLQAAISAHNAAMIGANPGWSYVGLTSDSQWCGTQGGCSTGAIPVCGGTGGTNAVRPVYFNGSSYTGVPSGNDYISANDPQTQPAGCPNGGTQSGDQCVCGSGQFDTGTSCVPQTQCLPGEALNPATNTCSCPSAGSSIGDSSQVLTFHAGASVTNNRVCFGYCQMDADTCIRGYLGGALKGTECVGPFKATGQSCNPSTFGGGTVDPSQPTPIEPNKPGHCWGQVDLGAGMVDVQLPCDKTVRESGATGGNTQEKTNPDGTKEVTEQRKEQTTDCDGDKCKTSEKITETKTTYDANGNPTGTTTTETRREVRPEDTEVGAFCQQNPTASICQQNKWGGTCGSFTCDGDAVQCAIAREIHSRNCQLYGTHSGGMGLGASEAAYDAATQPVATRLGVPLETQSVASLNTTDRFLSVASLQDETVNLWGGYSFVIPWSQLQGPLEWAGLIVLSFALLFAARIIQGAI